MIPNSNVHYVNLHVDISYLSKITKAYLLVVASARTGNSITLLNKLARDTVEIFAELTKRPHCWCHFVLAYAPTATATTN